MPTLAAAVRRTLFRLRAIFRRPTLDDDMQAEMREHLGRAADRYVARGMSPADARLAAKREFGNVTALQEEGRDARGSRWVDALAGDVRFAFRYFGRHKATTGIIVAVLALATGGNTVIFSLFQAQFIRPAPGIASDRGQMRIWAQERATKLATWEQRRWTQPELDAFTARREIFRDVAAWAEVDVVLQGSDSSAARAVSAQYVTTNFFTTLGVPLSAGQGFATDDRSAPAMNAIMAYAIAKELYGSAAAAVGRRILVNEVPVFVVGVAPERFQGAVHNMGEPALWMPLSARAGIDRVSPRWFIENAALSLFGHLAPNASREQATALARQVVTSALPDSATRVGMARTADVLGMRSPPPGRESSDMLLAFTVILVIGVLILLVGWMNVSSLMVAAAVGRRHEIAVRLSLGASRTRLLRQLVTESTILAVTGSAIGLTLAWWLLVWRQKVEIDGVNIAPDFGTFAFVMIMAVTTGVLFGLSPALHATRTGVANALRDSGAGTSTRGRLQRGFVLAQIALSQPLLVMLGVMLAITLVEYKPLPPQMSRQVISVRFSPLARTGAPSQRYEAVETLIPRIAERPEVLNVVPAASAFEIRGLFAPDRAARNPASDTVPTIVHLEGAAPGWFAMLDIPIILGRDVSLADTAAADRPVVIGSDLARALWRDANPIGRVLTSPSIPGWKQDSIAMTVVGVYDSKIRLPGMTWGGVTGSTNLDARVYTAYGRHWERDRILVRTRGPAAPFMPELQRFLRARAPSLPMAAMNTLAQADERALVQVWQMVAAAGGAAALALLLASLGLYGVVSLAVRQRTREIGIRIAVGAPPMEVARMFLSSGVRVSLLALAIGLPISIAALKIGMSQGVIIAPQVNPYLIGFVIAPVLVLVAAVATWLPARRAARVDPARTLRVE